MNLYPRQLNSIQALISKLNSLHSEDIAPLDIIPVLDVDGDLVIGYAVDVEYDGCYSFVLKDSLTGQQAEAQLRDLLRIDEPVTALPQDDEFREQVIGVFGKMLADVDEANDRDLPFITTAELERGVTMAAEQLGIEEGAAALRSELTLQRRVREMNRAAEEAPAQVYSDAEERRRQVIEELESGYAAWDNGEEEDDEDYDEEEERQVDIATDILAQIEDLVGELPEGSTVMVFGLD